MSTKSSSELQNQKNEKATAGRHIRVVTATSLFDGHDAAINIMRRVMQTTGMEIIHLGHNRSVQEIVQAAVQEDAHGVALTSYQGGHVEFFKYLVDELKDKSPSPVVSFGGGGGVILPEEIKELEGYGVTKIFSPEDGRTMGLQGMIDFIQPKMDFATWQDYIFDLDAITPNDWGVLAKVISIIEEDDEARAGLKLKVKSDGKTKELNGTELVNSIRKQAAELKSKPPVLGVTGTGGAGKSSLVDEFIRRLTSEHPDIKIALVAVDPSKSKTGGALLGDRLRMNAIYGENVFMRSVATRGSKLAISDDLESVLDVFRLADFDLILVETSGIGQSSSEITEVTDIHLYVMTPEFGAPTQLEKIDMLDYAHVVALNKFDRLGAEDALRSVVRQFKRNHNLFDAPDESIPVYGTVCSRYNDKGMNKLYDGLLHLIAKVAGDRFGFKGESSFPSIDIPPIIPPRRVRYLAEIAETIGDFNAAAEKQAEIADTIQALKTAESVVADNSAKAAISLELDAAAKKLSPENKEALSEWPGLVEQYNADELVYQVRGKEIRLPLKSETLSHLMMPKVALPKLYSHGDVLRFIHSENVPGRFPYTAGIFPLKREGEDPTRMFAGEGGPEQTNRRFHFLSRGQKATRLSTAFDSVTLYGENPDWRPDIYGKIGNSGVSICTLDDMKKLYSGFDLNSPTTSVSMTINGPAPMILAFFLNTVIDQACEKYIRENGLEDEVKKKILAIHGSKENIPRYQETLPETHNGEGLMLLGITGDQVLPKDVYGKIKAESLIRVRGTVQADILKEDQAQNTCIFNTQFALKMMGDIQEYFCQNKVNGFYSVSVSGYHMAEAGCNPITQLAFTLANGFTYVEYYLSRGLDINEFAPNLSFFFSNGLEPEYAVIGRVARRIWAKAMKYKYGANERSQKLKYHIQTSGRSLHAQEIDFNDIRTTLQALYAIYDNCNSLHTNAYDEAVTTPTEESVRRALAIQLIINRELGLAKNENPIQGAYIIRELTDLVEEAVLNEFHRISDRGGVLGAMETIYQRNKIQDESMEYESLKMSGEYPIIGVNTFLPDKPSEGQVTEVIRSSEESKNNQIGALQKFHESHQTKTNEEMVNLNKATLLNENIFEILMETAKVASLGQMSQGLYLAGGRYRRNL